MINSKKIILTGVIGIIVLVLVYYSIEVLSAKAQTPKIVNSYFSSGKVKLMSGDLTDRQIEILLKVQDPNFYNHRGVEFSTPGTGWTTITQSLAKIFYFKNFKQGFMKIKQTLCAKFALDPLVSKEKQLDLFINLMYFGNGNYGLTDAAHYYFSKEVRQLTEDEYISLIACIINPKGLNIKDKPAENQARVDGIKKVLSGEYSPKGLLDKNYGRI